MLRPETPPLTHSMWVQPGRFGAGEHPAGTDPRDTRQRLDRLIGAGFSYFVDLTAVGEASPYDHFLPQMRADDQRYVVYVRKPLEPSSVPRAPQLMADILDYLERALEVGHQVYLHGREGIGRTTLVVGCWLRRHGHAGSAALEALNRLWQGNPRSLTWPRVPGNERQERYVLDWSEPGEAGLPEFSIESVRALRKRYHGALLGLACGDALGSVVQFRAPGQFAALTDFVGGGHWQLPLGAWTDDTAMCLALAESLLACESFDADDQRRRYQVWQDSGEPSSTGQCLGITAGVAASLRDPVPGAAATAPPVGSDAQALTRVGAVALFAASAPARVFEWAVAAAAVTDASPVLPAGARYYAALMLAAIRGASRESLIGDAHALLGSAGGAPPAVAGRGSAVAALQIVLDALLRTATFRDGLLRVVNLGGDADIHGALYGQLAGAVAGIDGIPKAWRSALVAHERLERTADRLLAAALAPRE